MLIGGELSSSQSCGHDYRTERDDDGVVPGLPPQETQAQWRRACSGAERGQHRAETSGKAPLSRNRLVWVLSLVFVRGRAFTALVLESSRGTQSLTQASSKKISAQELESQFVQANVFPADVKLHCEPAMPMRDYICSYTPKDPTFPPRLHFGVNVDSKRWVQVSRTVQLGVRIPPLGL
jgi:hypothetical protein